MDLKLRETDSNMDEHTYDSVKAKSEQQNRLYHEKLIYSNKYVKTMKCLGWIEGNWKICYTLNSQNFQNSECYCAADLSQEFYIWPD